MSKPIALIGNGSIAKGIKRAIADYLESDNSQDIEIISILSRTPKGCDNEVLSIDELIATKPECVVECAGHAALVEYGEKVLLNGIPLIISSIGALADEGLYEKLSAAAKKGHSRIIIPSGALAGLDGLAAAKLDKIDNVTYRIRKPVMAWKGTIAEDKFDLPSLKDPTIIFKDNARNVAKTFPKNANVAASVALLGLGFEKTIVEVIADPTIDKNIHELSYQGPFGNCDIVICGAPSPDNPKTSRLTAYSLAKAIIDWAKAK